MLIADLDYSFFGWNKYFAIYGPYTYTEDWHEYPDYSSDPPTNKGDFLPLIDNGDSSKYYPVTANGQTYKIYNSAILNNSTGLYICLVCDRPWNTYQLNHDGSQSGEAWVQFQSINDIAQNGVYTCGYDEENPAFLWHSDGFLYNQGSYYDKEITDFHNIETELPIFTNNDDYMNYITNPVEKATCRVNYYLPDSDYTYTKITYKMNDKPQSVNDGTIVNIDPSQSSVDISNLTVHGNYWFTIFTNKSESEAFPYTIPVDPVPLEYKQYIDYINGSGFNFKNYPITYGDRIAQPIVPTVISQMSWVVGKNYARWDKIYPSTPITVRLTGDTTRITVTYEGYSNSEYTKCNDYYRIMYNDKSYDSQNPENVLLGDNVYTAYYGMNYYSVGNFTTEFAINNADNIQQALIFFTTRFKNIIIYVNNELWSNPF